MINYSQQRRQYIYQHDAGDLKRFMARFETHLLLAKISPAKYLVEYGMLHLNFTLNIVFAAKVYLILMVHGLAFGLDAC